MVPYIHNERPSSWNPWVLSTKPLGVHECYVKSSYYVWTISSALKLFSFLPSTISEHDHSQKFSLPHLSTVWWLFICLLYSSHYSRHLECINKQNRQKSMPLMNLQPYGRMTINKIHKLYRMLDSYKCCRKLQ